MNLKKAILLVSLAMCNIESLTTKVKKSMNACKSEIESEEKSAYCFINPHCFLSSFTIFFLFKSNSVISVAVDLLLCQLWFRYKFVKTLSEFTDNFFRICKCFYWYGNQEYWCWCSLKTRYLFYWECSPDLSAEFMLFLILLLWLCFWT